MHWVLQTNLFDEKAFDDLLTQLDRQQTKYSIVKMIPFAEEITPDVNVNDDNVFVCGSTAIGKVATKKGWIPGYFDENLDMELLVKNYGPYMLNTNVRISKLRDVKKVWDKFFIRPCSDKKEFAGMIMDWDEFEIWQQQVIDLDGESSYTSLTGDDKVLIAPLIEIYAEYRFYVVDGKVITGSTYKLGKSVTYCGNVDPIIYNFAQQMVDIWQPNRAFVIDIAKIENGLKVLEINSINSAGFYHCDMGKFVNAINSMMF